MLDWRWLVCLGLEYGDEGRYTCVAQNQFGVQEASAFLSITGIGEIPHPTPNTVPNPSQPPPPNPWLNPPNHYITNHYPHSPFPITPHTKTSDLCFKYHTLNAISMFCTLYLALDIDCSFDVII